MSVSGEGSAHSSNWRVSSYSMNGGGNCVEAGPMLDGSPRFAVRDSRH
ncbi:DUF397 domain-containing protein, partial [Halostreptopolyspora alba]